MCSDLPLQIGYLGINLGERLGITLRKSRNFGSELLTDTLHLTVKAQGKRCEPLPLNNQALDIRLGQIGILDDKSSKQVVLELLDQFLIERYIAFEVEILLQYGNFVILASVILPSGKLSSSR